MVGHVAFSEPPFKCTNEGWGEFEMSIDMYTTEKGGKISISHDLNFAAPTYEQIHNIQFKNPSQALQQILRETGPLPSDEERGKIKKTEGAIKKKKASYDVEKMAEGLLKLGEDDLLQVIQMIHDGKDESTYIQNNIDGKVFLNVEPSSLLESLTDRFSIAGEFSVDLYTLNDDLMKKLWEFMVR
jgi:transcription initiation factor IIF auxiliary subunit